MNSENETECAACERVFGRGEDHPKKYPNLCPMCIQKQSRSDFDPSALLDKSDVEELKGLMTRAELSTSRIEDGVCPNGCALLLAAEDGEQVYCNVCNFTGYGYDLPEIH